MKIAVTGPNGHLGSELVKLGCIPLNCDITDYFEIKRSIQNVEPEVIINCAAKSTPIDWCEDPENFKKAIAVNTNGVSALRDCFYGHLIHISTSYIFDGKHGPYSERPINGGHPVQNYGYSKFGGEVVLGTFNRRSTVVRTVGLFGYPGDFVENLVKTVSEGKQFMGAKDLYFNPTHVQFLAGVIVQMLYLGSVNIPNLINIASTDDRMSRYEFALMVAGVLGLDKDLIVPVNYSKLDWVAERPKNAGLKVGLAKKIGLKPFSALDGVKLCLEGIK